MLQSGLFSEDHEPKELTLKGAVALMFFPVPVPGRYN